MRRARSEKRERGKLQTGVRRGRTWGEHWGMRGGTLINIKRKVQGRKELGFRSRIEGRTETLKVKRT